MVVGQLPLGKECAQGAAHSCRGCTDVLLGACGPLDVGMNVWNFDALRGTCTCPLIWALRESSFCLCSNPASPSVPRTGPVVSFGIACVCEANTSPSICTCPVAWCTLASALAPPPVSSNWTYSKTSSQETLQREHGPYNQGLLRSMLLACENQPNHFHSNASYNQVSPVTVLSFSG